MASDQSQRNWEMLAEITDRLRRFESDMGYGPGGPMGPEFGDEPFWRYDDDMPPDLRAMFEEMDEVDREFEDGTSYDPEHPAPRLVHMVLGDYEPATGNSIDDEFGNALIDMSCYIDLARQASGERGYLDLFSQAGRELRHNVGLDKIKLVNDTKPEDYEAFPPLANLLRDVQQAYSHMRIIDV